MKELDYRVRQFGEMLFDERIEEYETRVIEDKREGLLESSITNEHMVELLQDMKEEWMSDMKMSTCLAIAFKEWMKGDDATLQMVLESDNVDFEVIGYMAVWVELYLGGREDEI